MSGNFTESVVEDAALAWLEGLGYAVLHLLAPPACAGYTDRQSNAAREEGGQDIAVGKPGAEHIVETVA
jgi:hypothetical protein